MRFSINFVQLLKFKPVVDMELLIEILSNKTAKNANHIAELKPVESIETTAFSDDFLLNLRASVADAENPEEAYNDVLEALEEVRLADKKQIKLQSAREFLLEFDEK